MERRKRLPSGAPAARKFCAFQLEILKIFLPPPAGLVPPQHLLISDFGSKFGTPPQWGPPKGLNPGGGDCPPNPLRYGGPLFGTPPQWGCTGTYGLGEKD